MRGHRAFRYATVAAVLACYAAILIGGNVMASDSGLACPDWPTCHGTFTPPITGGAGIEWAHRLSALVLASTIATVMGLALLFERGRPALVRLSGAASFLVLAQALLGGLVVESDLRITIVLLHLGLATALFGLLLALAFVANFRDLPPRWIEFARRASAEAPAPPRPIPDGPSPSVPPIPERSSAP